MISYGVLPTLDFIGHFSGSRLTQVGIEFPWVGMDNRKYPKFQVSSSCLACYVFFYVFNYKQYLFGIHFDFDIYVLIRPIYMIISTHRLPSPQRWPWESPQGSARAVAMGWQPLARHGPLTWHDAWVESRAAGCGGTQLCGGGFQSMGVPPKSSKSDHFRKPMVTWGSPILRKRYLDNRPSLSSS